MSTVNVYEQYFAAEAEFGGVQRRGALAMLISDSEAGEITYRAAVTFFPHTDETDFAVSYDAYFEKTLYEARGRRGKKRESALLETLRDTLDGLAGEADMRILWDRPLREARRG